jgi:methionyl-tRNA formyltransferase
LTNCNYGATVSPMRVVLLSPYPERIARTFASAGDDVVVEDVLHADTPADFVVSYGYRTIVREPVLSAFKGRIINIHISMLPFNRGADPTLWACIEGTPSGVSIHHIDAGIDTGELIGQRSVYFHPEDTFVTAKNTLRYHAEALFNDLWPCVRRGDCPSWKQAPGGTFHYKKAGEELLKLLPRGVDTPLPLAREITAKLPALRATA